MYVHIFTPVWSPSISGCTVRYQLHLADPGEFHAWLLEFSHWGVCSWDFCWIISMEEEISASSREQRCDGAPAESPQDCSTLSFCVFLGVDESVMKLYLFHSQFWQFLRNMDVSFPWKVHQATAADGYQQDFTEPLECKFFMYLVLWAALFGTAFGVFLIAGVCRLGLFYGVLEDFSSLSTGKDEVPIALRCLCECPPRPDQ